jgi:hypothetical protein
MRVRAKLSDRLVDMYCIPAKDTNPFPDIIEDVFKC